MLKREKLLKKSEHMPFSRTFIKKVKKWTFTLVYHQLSYLKLLINYFCLIFQDFYWRGKKRILSSKVQQRTFVDQKKLTSKNEFLLTLMQLRWGLLNEELVDRVGTSTIIYSNIFKTWVRFLAQILDKLAAWLPKENMKNIPNTFR